MKLLSFNAHSHSDSESLWDMDVFVSLVTHEPLELIALQEVCQSADAESLSGARPRGFTPISERVPLKRGNHALSISEALRRAGEEYFWTWLPMKLGYGRYDEGLAVFSRRPIAALDAIYLGKERSYEDWRTRMALGVRTEGSESWIYNVHMSRWGERGFLDEWHTLLRDMRGREDSVVLGDFNSPAHIVGEGYDSVSSSGFFDTYMLALERAGEGTARAGIDGWERGADSPYMRIDHIFLSKPHRVRSWKTVFDGKRGGVISDHFGVLAEIDG